MDLYEREGRLKEAQAVQTGLAGQPVGPATSPGPGPSSSDRGPPIASSNAQVRLASLLLKQGEHQRVVSALEPILKRLNSAELPSAMFLLGSAQLALAEAEKDSKVAGALLLEAGLNLMRGVVFFPEAGEAAHSLFLAGRVNERLGNASAARAAYSAVLSRFSGSAAAKQAKAALEQVKDK